MKTTLTLITLLFSLNAFSSTLTKELVASSLKYNEEKKYYDITFTLMAGIYKADEKFIKCFQKSIESKKAVRVTYEPMGLKITNCENK